MCNWAIVHSKLDIVRCLVLLGKETAIVFVIDSISRSQCFIVTVFGFTLLLCKTKLHNFFCSALCSV